MKNPLCDFQGTPEIREGLNMVNSYPLLHSGFNLQSQGSTQGSENGADSLIVYNDVPGIAASGFYAVRMRSAVTNNNWQESFTLITRGLCAENHFGDGS